MADPRAPRAPPFSYFHEQVKAGFGSTSRPISLDLTEAALTAGAPGAIEDARQLAGAWPGRVLRVSCGGRTLRGVGCVQARALRYVRRPFYDMKRCSALLC